MAHHTWPKYIASLIVAADCTAASGSSPGGSSQAVTTCDKDVWIANPVLNDCRVNEVPPCARSNAPFIALPNNTALYVGGFRGGDYTQATDEVDLFSLNGCGVPATFTPMTLLPQPLGATAAAWIPFKKNHANTGRLLIAGGLDTRVPWELGLQRDAYLFDPNTGIWTLAASLPLGHAVLGAKRGTAVLHDGSVIFYGGRASDSQPAFVNPTGAASFWDTRHTHRYFPAQDRWETSDMTEGRHYADHVILSDGRLVVAGGRRVIPSATDFSFINSVEIYDPEAPDNARWRITAYLPAVAGEDAPPYRSGVIPDPNGGRMAHAMARTADDKVLIVGGSYREPPWNCRNLSTLVFTDVCPASGVCPADGALCRPCPGDSICTASVGVCSDTAQTTCFPRGRIVSRTSVLIYDPATDNVDLATPMPEPRHNHLMQYLGDDEFIVAGGQNHLSSVQLPSTAIFRYTGDPAHGYGTWRAGPPLPSCATFSGLSSCIRSAAELEFARLADGTLWIGNGFDATAPGTTKPNGRSYVLMPSNALPLAFRPPW